MPCTLKDVAQLAEVSETTVSRVINGAENVSDDTRTKVLSAISRLDYRPDENAVKLRRGRSGIRRRRGIHVLSVPFTGTQMHSDSAAKPQNEQRRLGRLRLLEEENVRLKQLVTNLNMDVEMWRKVAQALSTEDASRTVVRRS